MKKDCLPVKSLLLFALMVINLPAFSQKKALGVFGGSSDVGTGVKPGAATFIAQTGQYVVSGAGYNIWGDHDEFHFLWKKMKGDFVLSARADFVGWNGVEQHRKVGWMVRKTLDGKSAHVNTVVHGDGLTSLQYRKTDGAATLETRSKITHATYIELERKGSTYLMRVSKDGKEFVTEEVAAIDLGNDVYVGVFVGSHNKDVVETGVFSNVKITAK